MTRRILAILMVLLLAGAVWAGGQAEDDQISIAGIIFQNDQFFQVIQTGMEAAAADFEVADVAPLVAFLCGPNARYVSGTKIYVDGAYLQGLVQYDPRPESRWTSAT